MSPPSNASLPVISLNGRTWTRATDFLAALKDALGAVQGCGWGPDAMVDLMVYGGMSRIEPPYVVRVSDVGSAPVEVREYIALIASVIAEARTWKKEHYGEDVEVSIEVLT
jgi:hypothetical protein